MSVKIDVLLEHLKKNRNKPDLHSAVLRNDSQCIFVECNLNGLFTIENHGERVNVHHDKTMKETQEYLRKYEPFDSAEV